MPISKNTPCPCGSGKKFKRCCYLKKKKGLSDRIQKPKSAKHSHIIVLACILIVLAGSIAYINSLSGVFVFDDTLQITDNPDIRNLAEPAQYLGNTRRPVLYASLAINYALGKLDPFGYHLMNLIIHLGSGIFLFGLILITVKHLPGHEPLKNEAVLFACLTATLWTVHPLHTQSVTYVIQRAESLMGLFFLMTLFFSVLMMTLQKKYWGLAAFVCTILGGLTKEVMVVVPLIVLLYDRCFISPSFSKALKRHLLLYLSFVIMWAMEFALLAIVNSELQATAGFGNENITPFLYALNQTKVIPYYVRLLMWPNLLIFDYAWPIITEPGKIFPFILITALMLGMAVRFFCKNKSAGFLALAGFIILLPSSSILPIDDLIFEYRMYLSSAAWLTLLCAGMYHFLFSRTKRPKIARQIFIIVCMCLITGEIILTIQRNAVYDSKLSIWQDTVEKSPHNARAWCNVGLALEDKKHSQEAEAAMIKAVTINPEFQLGHSNLASFYLKKGRHNLAEAHARRAIELNPKVKDSLNHLVGALLMQDKFDEAWMLYEQARKSKTVSPGMDHHFGNYYTTKHSFGRAIEHYQSALNMQPDYPDIRRTLADIYMAQNKQMLAMEQYRLILKDHPADSRASTGLNRLK